ncbi:MAG: VOC family protein [Beijerinckiaceae bacterium]|jgi:catechol 2,3-dioxygenase-like lactoylglutathione lyase family enzyme|nr:VOC family protein [Beijerinckiaceae bacterium]MDO9442858.1 VOC family protein [Beijerinckiaceae bacterium]
MSKKPMIRHIAIITLDPERLAKFYEETFQMERVKRPEKPGANTKSKAVFMTDGHITLALLHNKAEGKPPGLNHIGFTIDSQEEIASKIAAFGLQVAKRPDDRPFAETRATDPDGNNIDLSVAGYGNE